MSRLHPRPVALLLGIALTGSITQAAPPRQPGEEPERRGGLRSTDAPILIYDNLNIGARPRYAADHIVVRFGPSVSAAMRRQITWSLGGRDYAPARVGDFGRVMVRPGEDPRELVRRFRNNSAIEAAAVDWLVYAADGRAWHTRRDEPAQRFAVESRKGAATARSVPVGGVRPRTVPTTATSTTTHTIGVQPTGVRAAQSDPGIIFQWYHDKIRTPQVESLNATRGAGAVVAVIDTGVLFGSGNGATCESNFPRGRGVDLSGTQFVPGRDFVDNDDQPFDEGSRNPGAPPLSFRFGHGTFVTSIIAATADNDIAGAGVAPNVSIMPLRVLGRSGSGTFSALAEAIDFAVANGADVINMSLGANITPEQWNSTPAASAVRRAHAAGVVVVAATGNEADRPNPPNDVGFPARDPNVIAVGATRFNDGRTSYSDSGPGIDIMAPGGEDVFAVVERQRDIRDAIASTSFFHCPNPADCGGDPTICGFFWSTGTSFATPQVAAAAAMLKAIGVQDPDTIRTLLENGARDIGAQGFDNQTGHGLLDLVGAHEGFGFSFE